jgi:hypothetical protein
MSPLQSFASLDAKEKATFIGFERKSLQAFIRIATDAEETAASDADASHEVAHVVAGVVRQAFIALHDMHGANGIELFDIVMQSVIASTLEEIAQKESEA